MRYETLMETEFVAKHYRKAVKELYEENKVHIEGMGKRGGLLDNAKITFK